MAALIPAQNPTIIDTKDIFHIIQSITKNTSSRLNDVFITNCFVVIFKTHITNFNRVTTILAETIKKLSETSIENIEKYFQRAIEEYKALQIETNRTLWLEVYGRN